MASFAHGMDEGEIKGALMHRLEHLGIDSRMAPGFIRSLASSFFFNPNMPLKLINRRLHYLGWPNIELDYHTLQLALACFEAAGLNMLENRPARWFENHFRLRRKDGAFSSPPISAVKSIF